MNHRLRLSGRHIILVVVALLMVPLVYVTFSPSHQLPLPLGHKLIVYDKLNPPPGLDPEEVVRSEKDMQIIGAITAWIVLVLMIVVVYPRTRQSIMDAEREVIEWHRQTGEPLPDGTVLPPPEQ